MIKPIKVAILGPGNIGTDLIYKVKRSRFLELVLVAGIIPDSPGLIRAREMGIEVSADSIEAILHHPDLQLVFDATSARYHKENAPRLAAKGLIAVDLTPAAIGAYVVPAVNMNEVRKALNLNLISCGGQATVPIVAAVNAAVGVDYAEIVATISSKSAGAGTRQNIDEFTISTALGLEAVGGARKGKALIILNPADPPIFMHNAIHMLVREPDEALIRHAIVEMAAKVQSYVPGYRLCMPPLVDGRRVTVTIEVEGAGDFLPPYAGNLDIITSAAVATAERLAEFLDKSGEDRTR